MQQQNQLVIIDGPVHGTRFNLKSGTFRLIGRLDQRQEITMQVTLSGDQILTEQLQNRIQEHLNTHDGAASRLLFDERDNDILLEDPAVSKSHAMIFAHPNGLSVADLMSTNGVKVNGQAVNDASLKPGDRLRIGKTLLLFDDTGRA